MTSDYKVDKKIESWIPKRTRINAFLGICRTRDNTFGLSLIPPKYDGLREQIAYHLTAFHSPNDALCRVRTTKLAQHQPQSLTYCQRGNRAKKRGYLGDRFKIPRKVGKNSQILRNPLKFAFLTIFGCNWADVMILYLQLRGSKLGDPVCSCFFFSVQEALTGEQVLIRFLVRKGLLVLWFAL